MLRRAWPVCLSLWHYQREEETLGAGSAGKFWVTGSTLPSSMYLHAWLGVCLATGVLKCRWQVARGGRTHTERGVLSMCFLRGWRQWDLGQFLWFPVSFVWYHCEMGNRVGGSLPTSGHLLVTDYYGSLSRVAWLCVPDQVVRREMAPLLPFLSLSLLNLTSPVW